MALTVPPIKRGIYGFAAALVVFLAGLKFFGVDRQLLLILTLAGGLLVALLLITYRSFEAVAEAARNAPQPPKSAYENQNKDEDEDDK
jgi:hypothetical protein